MAEGTADKGFAEEEWIRCSRDVLYWVNVYCWGYDPRNVGQYQDPVGPFITYTEFQDEAFLDIQKAFGSHDVLIEKSRDMGASWICLLSMLHAWMFKENQRFLLVSRVEDMVDRKGDPDCLMWKLDFTLQMLPGYLKPDPDKIRRVDLQLTNLQNECSIDGASTTGEVGRGGRRTAILLDEFAAVENGRDVEAATRDACKCRLFNSTPRGTHNAFYERRQKMVETGQKILRFHWSRHPEKAKGLYFESGTGKPRSTWYDIQCERASHPLEILQELDIDYQGSASLFFDLGVLEAHERDYGRIPIVVGDLDIDEDALSVRGVKENEKGSFHCWLKPDGKNRMPADRAYVVGCDIATGSGASNSAISICDMETGEKVAQFLSPHVMPHELATIAVTLARWFRGRNDENGGAFLIWEGNGPGGEFGMTVTDLGYFNVWFRETNEKSIDKKISMQPGWFSTKDAKKTLLGDYRAALKENRFLNRSFGAIRTCREYLYLPSGEVTHGEASSTWDPSGARENHGDIVIADALCWRAMKDHVVRVETAVVPESEKAPIGSFAWRREQYQQRNKKSNWW